MLSKKVQTLLKRKGYKGSMTWMGVHEWLRKRYKIFIELTIGGRGKYYYHLVYYCRDPYPGWFSGTEGECRTFNSCVNAAILDVYSKRNFDCVPNTIKNS